MDNYYRFTVAVNAQKEPELVAWLKSLPNRNRVVLEALNNHQTHTEPTWMKIDQRLQQIQDQLTQITGDAIHYEYSITAPPINITEVLRKNILRELGEL